MVPGTYCAFKLVSFNTRNNNYDTTLMTLNTIINQKLL